MQGLFDSSKLAGAPALLLIVFFLIALQSVGGYLQIRDYQRSVRRLHTLGNVGIGQRRGRFLNGHVVIIACNSEGIITGAEVMDGIGVWARFHKVDSFLQSPLAGNRVSYFIEKTESFSKSQFKRYRGYIRALEALDARLNGKELTREQERHMNNKKSGKHV